MMFSPVASPPNCSDLERGRRPGNRADFRNFLKLGQTFNILHLTGGYTVEPIDIPPDIRHLEALRDIYTLTDKPTHSYSLGWGRIRDGIEMCRIARGIDRAQLEREPSLMTIINTSSPLRLDSPMAAGIIEMAKAGQIVVLTPFTLAGAMAPVTVAGAVAQQNAEALLGIALAQLVRPGAPVIYGGFTSNVDMKSGAPAFGTPEYMKSVLRRRPARPPLQPALPHLQHHAPPTRSTARRCTNRCSRSGPWSWAGGNLVKHSAGWLEGGLCASFEKLVIDVDTLQMVASFLEPLQVDASTLALDAIREVGPGGHFFGCAHTQERYRTAFYAPLVSDWRNYESWREAGAPDAARHANRIYKELVASYEPPPIDPAVKEELDAFVDRRVREGGAPSEF